MATDDALPSSKLGTLAHWDSVYTREVGNYDELGDEGEVWFGEEAVQRMVDFLAQVAEGDVEDFGGDDVVMLELSEEPLVLDVGTGNGHLLFALLEELATPLTSASNMVGIDYSAPSIELCKRIAQRREGDASQICFEQLDFLQDHHSLLKAPLLPSSSSTSKWDIVCDKGTFDAIALSAKDEGNTASDPLVQYVTSLEAITHRGSLFLITSCNFTEAELVRRFQQSFAVYHVVPVPSFSFGGQKGSTTVTIAFCRR